jgi:hypothetical protein
MTQATLRPVYSLLELARLMSMSKKRALRLLVAAGVPKERLGRGYVVYASDLETRLPKLWLSLVSCERERARRSVLA